jgi:putative transcriptional regulator
VSRQRADPAARRGEAPAGDGLAGEALADDAATIRVRLDELLSKRGMTLTELSARVDVTVVNLSILKNGRARAIRFSTMARLCEALQCQPGDLLGYEHPGASETEPESAAR